MSEQIVETSSNLDTSSSVNSFESSPAEMAAIPDSSPEATSEEPTTQEPQAATNESTEGELPEFAKRRLGREQKKHEREMARLRAELEEVRQRANQSPQQPYSQPYGQPQSVYQDPLMANKYIDTSTPEGQAIFKYQQELSQHLSAQEREAQERQNKEIEAKRFAHFQDSFLDAKDKYADFETVMRSSGMNESIAQNLADFPDPGELGYYLASNPREVERLQRLPAYEIKRELARHMAEMVSKNNVTRAPAPVKTTGSPSGQMTKHFAHKTLEELKAERRAELSGASRRR